MANVTEVIVNDKVYTDDPEQRLLHLTGETFTEKEKTFLRNLRKDGSKALNKFSYREIEILRKEFYSYPALDKGLFEIMELAFILGYRRGLKNGKGAR